MIYADIDTIEDVYKVMFKFIKENVSNTEKYKKANMVDTISKQIDTLMATIEEMR